MDQNSDNAPGHADARHFEGVIGRDFRTSTPWWPPDPEPPAGAPNVLMLVLDDVGFAQLGCYGSDISTPAFDGLARDGLRMTNFHTTALCSPTRSCLLTGRNHHRNGMGRVADLAVGYPGYWGRIPRENGFLSEILRGRGYATYAVGKWHLTPDDETHMAASRASWPIARGFDRWYGFHGGETHQFVPSLYHDNHSVLPPARPEEGYHLSADLADRAIQFLGDLRAVDADRPFFCYFATGACHSPHHAPKEWIDRYRGQFDAGWDAWREATFAAPDRDRRAPRAHEAHAPPALGAGVGLVEGRGPRGRGALHGVLRRVPVVHRRADRAAARVPRTDRRSRQHADRRGLRQRRERRGRTEGFDQRRPPDERCPRGPARAARPHRRDRRADRAQQLSVGLDDGRQHAVQALEARGARRRRRRPVHRGAAEVDAWRDPRRGRDPAAVRARDRRPADRARPRRHRPSGGHRGRRAVARSTGRASRRRCATRRHRRRTRPNTSRCSGRAGSTTGGGRR